MDVVALAGLFRSFHGEVDSFVRRESEKLFEQEARNQQARRNFQEVHDMVRGFIDEFAPAGGLPEPKATAKDSDDGDKSRSGDSAEEDEGDSDDATKSDDNASEPKAKRRKVRRKDSRC